MDSNQRAGVQLVGDDDARRRRRTRQRSRAAALEPRKQQAQLDRGRQIYNELCFACHGTDGLGTPTAEPGVTMAPPLAGSPRVNAHRDYIINVVLNGLIGPLDGKTYTDAMIPMDTNDDEWVAAGHVLRPQQLWQQPADSSRRPMSRACAPRAPRARHLDVAGVHRDHARPLDTEGWKPTASHNADAAVGALESDGMERRAAAADRPCGSRSSCRRRRW